MTELPVVVIGAGPIGLAAAAQLRERGLTPLVFERGAVAGAAIAEWNHVRLFSRWSELVDPAARLLLEQNGWSAPDGDAYPTGQQWRQLYLEPLAAALGDAVQFGTEVVGVARRGRDLVVDAGRETEPLSIHLRRPGGSEDRVFAQGRRRCVRHLGHPEPARRGRTARPRREGCRIRDHLPCARSRRRGSSCSVRREAHCHRR